MTTTKADPITEELSDLRMLIDGALLGPESVVIEPVLSCAGLAVDALQAVLDMHRPGPVRLLGAVCQDHEAFPHFSITSTEADRVRACPACSATVCISCTCGYVERDRCPHRLAIIGALTTPDTKD